MFFIFDPEKDEFISSDPNYHSIENYRFMRNGEEVSGLKHFLLNFYAQWRPQNKTSL